MNATNFREIDLGLKPLGNFYSARAGCRLIVGRTLLGGEQDEGVEAYRLLKRED